MLTAVLDTSVFIAGYLARRGTSHSAQVLSRWRSGKFQLIMSPQIMHEVVATLSERRVSDSDIADVIKTVTALALNIPGTINIYRLDYIDANDNMFLAAAQEASADYLVSLDKRHLLPLKHHKRTQIVTPFLFIRALDKEPI